MKAIHFSAPHVYVAVFRCDRCNGPTLSRIISEGFYSDADISNHPFPTECPICLRTEVKRGYQAEKILTVEWNHEIHFQPDNEDIS